MKHIDLFSGIGGFALAAKWTWGDEYQNVGHSEVEPFPCKVYHKHFPESECLGDITKIKWEEVIANADRNRSQKPGAELQASRSRQSVQRPSRIDLLTGGFPCQPFSVAGQRRGKEDDRALWHEMLRAIREVKPRWVIGENVAGIINMELDNVLFELEAEGYQTETFVIPACAVNAPHRRDRVWIVAHASRDGEHGQERQTRRSGGGICQTSQGQNVNDSESIGRRMVGNDIGQAKGNVNASAATNKAFDSHAQKTKRELTGRARSRREGFTNDDRADSNTDNSTTPRQRRNGGKVLSKSESKGLDRNDWDESWYEVATRLCRMDDGVRNRVDRLKSLGNAIVPQVAYEIMKAIKEVDPPHLIRSKNDDNL